MADGDPGGLVDPALADAVPVNLGAVNFGAVNFGPTINGMRSVAQAFAEAGYELFLVGGIVRDTMLGLHEISADIDATTSARPDTIKRLLAPLASSLWTQGERFGTIGARIGRYDVEVTTYRAEDYAPDSRKPEVAFGDDLRSDLARRDFTINAMAVSLIDEQFHDPFGGLDDLGARRLRTPLDPRLSFSDDPLRMLRAARFLPRFELEADAELIAAAKELASRLDIVSKERVHDELERLLAVDRPARGLEFLARAGLLGSILGFEPQNGEVAESFRLVETANVLHQRRIGFLAPYGSQAAAAVLARLRYSTDDRRHTVRAVELLESLEARAASAPSVRQLIADARHDLDLVDDVLAVGERIPATHAAAAALRSLLDDLARREELVPEGSPLDGEAIMAAFDLEPGPEVGKAVAYLRKRGIERGPMSPREALEELRNWGALTPRPNS